MFGRIHSESGVKTFTCPWRGFFDPGVRLVLDVVRGGEHAKMIAKDPSAWLVNAVGFYERCDTTIKNHDIKERMKKAKAKGSAPAPPGVQRRVIRG